MTFTVKTLVTVHAASTAEEAAAYAAYPSDVVLVVRTDLLPPAPPPPPPPPPPSTYEDLTTYTEVDPSSQLAVTSATATATALSRNTSTYLYKDFGAAYFAGDFSFDFECKIVDFSANYAGCLTMALNNAVQDYQAAYNAAGYVQGVYVAYSSGCQIFLHELHAGSQYNSGTFGATANTNYYMTFRRNASAGTFGTLYLDIYSDAARTALITTLSLVLHSNTSFRYLDIFQSINSGSSLWTSAVIKNVSL